MDWAVSTVTVGLEVLRLGEQVVQNWGGTRRRVDSLAMAWHKLQADLWVSPNPWGQAKGPIAATILCLKEAGWEVADLNAWRSDLGVTYR